MKINMIVNLPFGGSVEIKTDEYDKKYAYGKRYRFKIVDEYGWDISKEKFRDMRINSLIGEQSDFSSYNILYHIYLSHSDSLDTLVGYLDLKKSELRMSGDRNGIRLKCTSLYQAEDIIDMILGYEVSPVNRIDYRP